MVRKYANMAGWGSEDYACHLRDRLCEGGGSAELCCDAADEGDHVAGDGGGDDDLVRDARRECEEVLIDYDVVAMTTPPRGSCRSTSRLTAIRVLLTVRIARFSGRLRRSGPISKRSTILRMR